jgi:hypothetical protein
MVERRSRVHVEVWAHGEKLHILNRFWGATEEFLKASCDTFTTIGKCRNLDTQGQRATKEKCRTVESQSKVEEKTQVRGSWSWRQR